MLIKLSKEKRILVMIENEKFDIFIAYYGNKDMGSEYCANELYEYINNKEIYPGKRIKAYFHPVTNPYGRFEDTPLIVARTPLFLLVADKNIKRTSEGQLSRQRDDGSLSNVYEEVRTFHDSLMYKSPGGDNAVKLYITDDFSFKAGECLHPMFSGKTALRSKEDVVEWIIYFYRNTYISRLYTSYKYLVNTQIEEFKKGEWVKEAEDIWSCLSDVRIGRTLMTYYVMDLKSNTSKRRFKEIYKELNSLPEIDLETRKFLDIIRNDIIGKI